MDVRLQVETLALVEKLHVDDLPVVAATLLQEWCERTDISHESIIDFAGRVLESQQEGTTRRFLANLLGGEITGAVPS